MKDEDKRCFKCLKNQKQKMYSNEKSLELFPSFLLHFSPSKCSSKIFGRDEKSHIEGGRHLQRDQHEDTL